MDGLWVYQHVGYSFQGQTPAVFSLEKLVLDI